MSSLGLVQGHFRFTSWIYANVGYCISIYVIQFWARVLALPLTLSFIVNVYCSDLSLHSTQKHLFSQEKHFHSCELNSRKSLLLSFENCELETLTYIIFVEAIVTKTFMADPTTKKLLVFFFLFASMTHFSWLLFLHCICEHWYLNCKLAWNDARILSSIYRLIWYVFNVCLPKIIELVKLARSWSKLRLELILETKLRVHGCWEQWGLIFTEHWNLRFYFVVKVHY